ncbi:MAG: hypothetical protein ABTQ93_08910 [Candidatus Competibacter denitrificans]
MSENAQNFLWFWGAIIIANQILFFGGCFKPYCIIAALPHTLVLAVFCFFGYKKFLK